MKHTLIPWAVGEPYESGLTYRIVSEHGASGLSCMPATAHGRNEEEALANARLIAAAPDLLAACKLFLNQGAAGAEIEAAVLKAQKGTP